MGILRGPNVMCVSETPDSNAAFRQGLSPRIVQAAYRKAGESS